ncbi:GyrI-like domain-containing protein [Rothia sp. P6271]|uniref:GyrI-like domain-containing protein n=1 Tax=unclassified Rothia (in: high G+C Gram-positive bacteria) TaxID=2689056 RepID=UPI003ACABF6C
MADPSLIEYDAFLVAGINVPLTPGYDTRDLWQQLYEQLGSEKCRSLEKMQRVGVIMPDAEDQGLTYTAGYMVRSIAEVSALGLTGVIVPRSMYATVLINGAEQNAIDEGFDVLASQFIPAKALSPTGVRLEVYGPADMDPSDYRMYVWSGVTGISATPEDVFAENVV